MLYGKMLLVQYFSAVGVKMFRVCFITVKHCRCRT